MSDHHCFRCGGLRKQIAEHRAALVHMLRVAEKHPGTLQAKGNLAQIPAMKAKIKSVQENLAEHLEGVS